MKKIYTSLLTTSLLLGALIPTSKANAFSDVTSNAWYSPYINYVAEQGLMDGTGGVFSPVANSNRGTVAQALATLGGQGDYDSLPVGYWDVEGSPYASGIAWCLEHGVMSGYSADTFAPDDALTREAFAASLYNFGTLTGMDMDIGSGPLAGFGDVGSISGWAVTPMAWAVDKGLMTGSEDGLNPQGSVTRSELAVMLTAYDHLKQGKDFDPSAYASSPEIPNTAETPETPSTTETPSTPDSSATPSTPDTTETPDTSWEESSGERYEVVEIWGSAWVESAIYQQPNEEATQLTTLAEGDRCQVYGYTADGYFQVMRQGYWGYVPMTELWVADEVAGVLPQVGMKLEGFLSYSVFLHQGPGEEYEVTYHYTHPTYITILGEIGDWYQLEQGYVHKNHVELSTGMDSYRVKEAAAMIAFPEEIATGAELGVQIAEYAQHFVGYPYRANTGDLNGFDCAGFASYVYGCFGIEVGTTPRAVWADGVELARAELQPGDLIVFGTLAHVGIYIGDNHIVHSMSSTYVNKVLVSSLTESYYANNYNTARRYIEN